MILVDHGAPWAVIAMIFGGVSLAWLGLRMIERRYDPPVKRPSPWATWE